MKQIKKVFKYYQEAEHSEFNLNAELLLYEDGLVEGITSSNDYLVGFLTDEQIYLTEISMEATGVKKKNDYIKYFNDNYDKTNWSLYEMVNLPEIFVNGLSDMINFCSTNISMTGDKELKLEKTRIEEFLADKAKEGESR